MKRLPVILSIVLVVACVACLGLGALFLFMQSQTVAQATAVPTRLATLPPQTPAAMCAPTPFSAATQSTFTPETTITAPAFSDKGIRVALNRYTNGFPKALTFQIEAEGNNSINEVALIVMLEGQTSSSRQLPEFTPGNKIQATYEWTMSRSYVPPGVTGQFWWTLGDSSGNQIQTPKQSFRMDDPGRTWQKLANDKLAVYWYGAGDSFGKALFDRGVEAMQFLLQDTCVVADKQVQAFIYPNRTDFRNALSVGAQEWTGGQAFPDYSIVLINVAPQELEWGKGATTHELTHLVIHQRIQSPLGDLSMPHWMDEGLAMYYETYPAHSIRNSRPRSNARFKMIPPFRCGHSPVIFLPIPPPRISRTRRVMPSSISFIASTAETRWRNCCKSSRRAARTMIFSKRFLAWIRMAWTMRGDKNRD